MLLLLLGACTSKPPTADTPIRLKSASFSDLPGWNADAAASVLPAMVRSCERMMNQSSTRTVGNNGIAGTVADWYPACAAVRRLSPNDHETARAFFETWFTPHLATADGVAEGLFTGYFEPELRGSLTPSPRFHVPILARPSDLEQDGDQVMRVVNGRAVPYPPRAEIEAGVLGDAARPLVWVDDPVEAHILHIQGSGRIRLEDGSVVRLGVAATNGRKFVGIGRVMKDEGLIDDLSMPAIRAWLKANPERAKAVMAKNPRYVFYRVVKGEGPLGAEGVALTPGRSLAVDTRNIPLGIPLFLDTVEPGGTPIRRLVMAQDVGSAIRGAVRGDLFWGAGENAFQSAGRMKSTGRYWLLLPKDRAPRVV